MSVEKWRWRSSTASTNSVILGHKNASLTGESPDTLENKKPRTLTRALRSMSSSSLDSVSGAPTRSSSSGRKLQKTSTSSISMIERLQRRVSRDSTSSIYLSESPGNIAEQPFPSMEIVRFGWLKTDVSLLKARSGYLVLTDHSLVKFGSAEAARVVFPQLSQTDGAAKVASGHHGMSVKAAVADIRFEIPLRSIVAVFNEEISNSRLGIEVWWFSQSPRLAYSKAHLFFSLPKERDEWLAAIQNAYKTRLRKNPINSTVPENLRIRIKHLMQAAEDSTDDGSQTHPVFPVAKRLVGLVQKGVTPDDTQENTDVSSLYLVIGPCLCYFVEVLKADYTTSPGELRMKSMSFGTVTLTRFRASVASNEQRFMMCFRTPFGRETRLDLASAHYRRIIETLTKLDRILKPMWPQNLQQAIFDIKGLPPPLQLTSGNDLGGLQMSLQAYCAAFHVQIPCWKIEWNTPSQPSFRLLPSNASGYSPLQLLAVFRALRYNSYFKAISFRDVDFSSLAGRKDYSQYGDSVVNTSLNGLKIPKECCDILLQAPILEQEIHALMFASESIRNIDLTNVFNMSKSSKVQQGCVQPNYSGIRKMSSEILRPILVLLEQQLSHCHSISMSGNYISAGDVDELANILVLEHVNIRKLDLSTCGLTDADLSKLWLALSGQAKTLDCLDISNNQGIVKFDVIRQTMSQFRAITKLNISGSTRINSDKSLFVDNVIQNWPLEELDLSGIMLNDATIEVLATYLEATASQNLKVVRLNSCSLTGRQVARLFRSMGQARQLTVHINANRLDEGIDDLCGAIGCNYGPWSLFVQMVEFCQEASYIKLLRALTINNAIECLSLAGSTTPDAASSTACSAVADFFSKNNTVRFLDISGYDSKLDEGRLGREFSRALSGLKANTRIQHLRVRSQMLNINIGDLANAIAGNKTLHTIDCEGNDFNLSNFRHLVKSLESNTTIIQFSAFSQQDLVRSIQKSVDSAGPVVTSRRSSIISRLKHDKPQPDTEKSLAQHLRDEWEAAVGTLQQVLDRNQTAGPENADFVLLPITQGFGGDMEGEKIFSNEFGGLALKEYESRRAKSHRHSGYLHLKQIAEASTTPVHITQIGEGGSDLTTTVEPFLSISPVDGLNSETSDSCGSTESGFPSPPEVESPGGAGPDCVTLAQPDIMFEEAQEEDNYSFTDVNDADLLMKRYRRFWGDPNSRIEEEDDKVEEGTEFV